LRALSAIICAGFDEMPLEGGEAGQDRHQQFALRRRRIAPRIVQALELGAFLGQGMQDVDRVASRAG
jgi:hypothetical protein